MRWTWPRTLIGLTIVFLLGGAALFIEVRLDAQRDGIIASGQRVAARVVEVRRANGADQSVVEYTANGRTRRAEISDWSGLSLEMGAWVSLHLDPSSPERVATSDGYSSLPGRSAPFTLGMLAAALAIVVIAGRAVTAYNSRTEPFWTRRPRVWFGRRGMVRRNDWFSRFILGIGLAGTVLALWAGQPLGTTVAFMSPIVVCGYLSGVSCGVVVTPVELLVYKAFTVISIPRHLVKGFEARGNGYVGIGVAGHRRVEVGVGISSAFETGDGTFNRRPSRARTIAQLEMLVAAIPQKANAGDPGTRRRWATIIALAASLAGFALLTFGVFTGRIPSA